MKLSQFLDDLLVKGAVTVGNQITDFTQDDLDESLIILKNYYEQDKLEMPFTAPDFSPNAAMWSAQYLYHSIQLAMLRDLDDKTVDDLLKDFPEKLSPEIIYSVDLCFRYLPQIFDFIKGLAPEDILVKILEKTAFKWAFSSVGIDLKSEQPDLEIILNNQSLSTAYIDRIIKGNDLNRVNNEKIKELIKTSLGNYPDILWDNFLSLEL